LGGVPERAARVGCLAYGTGVGFLGSLRQTGELQTLDHSLSQFSHGDTSRLKIEQPGFFGRNLEAVYRSLAGWDLRERMIELFRDFAGKVFICAQRLVQQRLAADGAIACFL